VQDGIYRAGDTGQKAPTAHNNKAHNNRGDVAVKATTGRDAADPGGPAGQDLLGIYLNDHLAGATGGLELARRAAAARHDRAAELDRLAGEIFEDRAALIEMMAVLGIRVRRYKIGAAWLAEKAGRLKLNGRLLGRSPLSGLLELELLSLGVVGKAAVWRALRVLADRDDRLDAKRLDRLAARADRQVETLEGLRQRAAAEVFAAR
jgi:hypothetical protein